MNTEQPLELPLWAEGEIDTRGWDEPESIAVLGNGLKVIRNVSRPSLTVYLPDPAGATGTAVIVAPGGAYHFLAYEHEGIEVARWLNQHGIAAFLLKYRLVQTGDDFPECVDKNLSDDRRREELFTPLMPLISADGCRAVRLVREHAAEWGVDPAKVGITGFSAGGGVTFLTTLFSDAAGRPNFAAPIYAAPPPEAPVPADAPPLFLVCAADDEMANSSCLNAYNQWRAAGKPVELHIYAQGGHGFGMNHNGLPSDTWIERLHDWMKSLGF